MLARAFVHEHRPDLQSTAAGILRGRLVIVQDKQLGSGAWACLATDKQHELTVVAIHSDASPSAAVQAARRDYDQAERVGSLPQANGADIYPFRLSRTVRTFITGGTAAALVASGLLSVLLFPALALTLLSRATQIRTH